MKKNIIIWPILLITLLIVSAIIFDDYKISADQNSINSNINSMSTNSNNNLANNNSDATTNTNPVANNQQQATDDLFTNLQLPVLMYHHIRDFSDPSDQIGTNLSVSPTDFASQLDKISERDYKTITFNDISSGNIPDKSIILTFDDGYENFYQNAYPELKKRGMTAVSYIITDKVGTESYMTRDQIIEIEKYGIEIGSHTLSHPDLATASEARATKEIVDSKKYLEELIGKKIISLCYPSGKFNASTEIIVKNAGYKYAVTTKSSITTFNDVFALNRYRVNNGTSISNWIK